MGNLFPSKTNILSYLLLLLTFGLFISCQDQEPKVALDTPLSDEVELGKISIDVSCSSEALPAFKEGMLLLHSFQFDDAAEKFQEAQEIDSACAMAFWGEAMSENHPLWREQKKTKALDILKKLGSTIEDQRQKFKTDFEKDMFEAITILYGEGTKKDNDKAYAVHMEKLYKKYPDNHEVSAFYALSLLGSQENGRDKTLYSKGASIAQSIIDENPNHPGALHYLIHSYDDPENAPKALSAANRYAKVAPDAAHALHMPSHIYVALGMWDEVIKSNTAAVAASIERRERKELEIKAIDFHSLKWLMYGYLQKGEYEKAKELVFQMEEYCEKEHSSKAVSHTVMMKGAYLTETDDWDKEILEDSVDYSDLPIQIYGARCWILGMEAFKNKDKETIDGLISQMSPKLAEARTEAIKGSSSMCSGSYDRSRPNDNQVKRTVVVQMQLEALLAMLNNKNEKVESILKDAIKKEEETTYMYGPPDIVKPTHEMYADWLKENNRIKEAKQHYESVLERAPGRYIAENAIKELASR